MSKENRKICITVLAIYAIVFFVLAVLSREPYEEKAVLLKLFHNYSKYDGNVKDVILNIAAFVPIGLLIGTISDRYRVLKALFFGFLFSLFVEVTQLISHCGVFDVDDLFNNSLGALIGGVIAAIVVGIVHRYKNKR